MATYYGSHASLFRFISRRNASLSGYSYSRVTRASTVFPSVLRQKPEEKASGCTAAKWKDNFAEPGQTFDGFEHPAPRFPFPRFITTNFVSSFVSTLLASHLRFSLFLPIPPSLLYSLPPNDCFFELGILFPGSDPAKGFARERVPLYPPNIHRGRGK